MSEGASVSPYSKLSYPEEVKSFNCTYNSPLPINYDSVATTDDKELTTMLRALIFPRGFETQG
jgi:hypothetical protein